MVLPTAVDFETHPIGDRPSQMPPIPVGVAICRPGRAPVYRAWGHPSGNNCTLADAKRELRDVWRGEIVAHNAAYEIEVAHVHLGLKPPPWHRVHCTQILAFLHDPNAERLGLKELAEDYLGMPPDEQRALYEWICEHIPGAKRRRRRDKDTGDWIYSEKLAEFFAQVPAGKIAPYAKGDVVRTLKLFAPFYEYVRKSSMQDAYERERKVMLVALKNSALGAPVDVERLARDERIYADHLERTDVWIRKRLRAPHLDVGKAEQLADALEDAGKLDEWILTAKGRRSTSYENLVQVMDDRALLNVLFYRGKLSTALSTFMRPWQRIASVDGYVRTSWNTTKGSEFGARTGRLSSTPNLQNISKVPTQIVYASRPKLDPLQSNVIELPAPLRGCGLPNVRGYIVVGQELRGVVGRDYAQQELRILAHYEDDRLAEMYRTIRNFDLHSTMHTSINDMLHTAFARTPIKNTGFAIIYGAGSAKTARQNHITTTEAGQIRSAYYQILPGVKQLNDDLKERARNDEPIRTIGGRVYYVEPPREVNGELWSFEYKMLNTLIQGSAADVCKQAWINYDEMPGDDGRVLLTVHDEFANGYWGARAREMHKLKMAMEAVNDWFDVPMLTDGKWSTSSWGEMQ